MISTESGHPDIYKFEFIFINLKHSLLYPVRSCGKHIKGVFAFRQILLDRLDNVEECVVYMWFLRGVDRHRNVFQIIIKHSDISRNHRHGLNQSATRKTGPHFTIMPAYSVVQHYNMRA